MPEEALETADLKEQIEQGVERALEAVENASPPWTMYLSLSTAIVAVFAAIASLESGAHSNDALIEKNEAVLAASRASDQWSHFQAKGLKGLVTASLAELVIAGDAARGAKMREEGHRYRDEQAEIEKRAREFEAKVVESNELAAKHLETHHKFAISVTVFQIAIALSAIAALTRRKPLWYVGLAASAVGIGFFAYGFVA